MQFADTRCADYIYSTSQLAARWVCSSPTPEQSMMPRRAVSDHALFPVAQALLVMHLFDGFPSQTVRPVVTDAATVTEVVLAGMLYCSLR